MKLFKKMKDGGIDSTVTGYWLIESKKLFSICLLKFEGNSRDAFHNHAFNSISWLLKGELQETLIQGFTKYYKVSFKPIITTTSTFHKVDSIRPITWVISFRGPWRKTWKEFIPAEKRNIILTHGRVQI